MTGRQGAQSCMVQMWSGPDPATAEALSWAESPRWRNGRPLPSSVVAPDFLSSPAEEQSELGFKGTQVFWMVQGCLLGSEIPRISRDAMS